MPIKFVYRIVIVLAGGDGQRLYGPSMEYTESQFNALVKRIHSVYKDPNGTFETLDLDGNAMFIPSRNIFYLTLEKG
jgi:mannose-1-phosphate guanylyltransferase